MISVEIFPGAHEGRLLVVHGTSTDDGDGRVLVHKTPFNRDDDECWMFEAVMQDGELFHRLVKATGRHQGKYMVTINEHDSDEEWMWADVTDREDAMDHTLWRIIVSN